MLGLGPWEIAAITAAALLLFGAKRLPQLARGLGQGIREFRTNLSGPAPEEKASSSKPPSEAEQS